MHAFHAHARYGRAQPMLIGFRHAGGRDMMVAEVFDITTLDAMMVNELSPIPTMSRLADASRILDAAASTAGLMIDQSGMCL